MPLPIVGGLVAFLGGWFARIVGVSALRFIALKVVLWTLCVSVLPIVIYNVFSYMVGEVFGLIEDMVEGSSIESYVLEFTGLGGWLANTLNLPEAFALILSACIFRMTLNMIPFVGKV